MSWPSDKVGYVLKGFDVFSFNLLYKTSDSGLTWNKVDTIDNKIFGVYFLDSLKGYEVGFGGMIRHTLDGGRTWEYEYSGTHLLLGLIRKEPDNHLYIYGDSNLILVDTTSIHQGVQEDFADNHSILVYPNPCNTFLTLSWTCKDANEKFNISIYDLLGKEVYQEQKLKSLTGISRLETLNFNIPNGMYLLELRSEKGYKTIVKIAVQ